MATPITGDNSTVVTFAQVSGAGTLTDSPARSRSPAASHQDRHRQARGLGRPRGRARPASRPARCPSTSSTAPPPRSPSSAAATDLSSGAGRVLTATVRDAAGNPVTNDNSTVVAFAKDSGAGTVSGLGNDTAAAGVATKTVTGVLAGSVTLEASAAGLAGNVSFDVVAGAATQIALSGSTADLGSGATRVLTATIQDAAGNPVTADNTTVVTFAKPSGTGTVAGAGTATAASGVATRTVTGALVGMRHDGSHGDRAHHRHAGLVHGRPRGRGADRALRLDRRSHFWCHAAADRDRSGRRRQHRHCRQLDRRRVREAGGAGTVSGTGTATASSGVAAKTVTDPLSAR